MKTGPLTAKSEAGLSQVKGARSLKCVSCSAGASNLVQK